MDEMQRGDGAGVTAVLKLLRPRGGARPSKFRLPGYGENEIKVGRNGEVCDVFLYVDEHPSFLSRVHAIFRHKVPEVEDPDTGSSDEEDVTEEEKASTDDRGFATQPSSSQTQPNVTQGEQVPVTTPSPSRTRDQAQPQPQSQSQSQSQSHSQRREQANQANAQTHVHAQALAQIFNQIARSKSRSARSFSTLGNVSASTRRSVSRTHAAVEKMMKKPQWEVIDQDSVNGVFLNGEKLEPKVPHVLEQGDRIFFGNPLHSFFLEYEYLELRSDSKEALEFERIAQRKREQKRAKSKANSQLPFSFRNNSIRYTEHALNANRSALLNEVSQSISSSNRRFLRENYLQVHDAIMNSFLRQNASTLLAHDLQLPVGQRRKRSRDLFESRGNLSAEQSLAFAPYFHEHSGQHTGSVNSIGNPSDLALTPLRARKAPRSSSVASDEGTMMDEGDSASTEGDDVASDLKVDTAVHSSGDLDETLDQAGRKGQPSKQTGATKSLLLEKLGKDLWHIMLSFVELPEIFRMRSVCKEIKRLNDFSLGMVKHIKWSPDQTRLDTFLKLCPNIIEIDASGCYDLGDSHVEIISQRVPNIEQLDLSGCARISDRSIRALTENCDKIRSLRLRACKRIAATEAVELLTILGEKCTNLTHLDMRCCNLDDESLITLLSKCNNLTYLDIGSTGFARVSDRVLFALAKHCTKLEDLGVMCCREITDAGIERVAQGCGRTLRNLTVHCCFNLTDLSLVYLSKYCERLETLNVHRCVKISEFGFEQLATGCGKTLRSLDVSACIVNDGALTSIAQNCPNLRVLDLRSCEDITSILQIAKHCPELEQLDLTCCKNLDDRAVYALATYCKKLTQIEFGKFFNISKAAHEVLQKALGDSASLYF